MGDPYRTFSSAVIPLPAENVDTAYSPGRSASPFMAMHIEQPGWRHSAPAARKILSRPSASASRCTCIEPGTTSMRMPAATLRPSRTRAAARRSEMRPFVQLPMKTTWTGWPAMACPGRKPM